MFERWADEVKNRVTVKAPATTSNLGAGFDCLGLALDLWNTVQVEVGSSGFEVYGEGEDKLDWGPSNLVYRAFRLPFEESGQPVPEVTITCWNRIPLERGLGSSSAALIAGLMAGNHLSGDRLDDKELLRLAADMEGHPDNVAPALLGGLQIVVSSGKQLITAAVPTPDGLKAVAFIPTMPIPTKEARAVLPHHVSLEDAVYNIGRVALLVRALTTGDLAHLSTATEDRLHQPARRTLFPAMGNIFRAALGAGARAAFLSGAGSTVLALTMDKEMTIGYEMADAAAKSGVDGTVKVTRPSKRGAHVVEVDC